MLESNPHLNYFACELNCVISRFNSTAISNNTNGLKFKKLKWYLIADSRFFRPISSILIPPQNPALNCVQNLETSSKYCHLLQKWGRQILDWMKKYIIISIDSPDSIQARYVKYIMVKFSKKWYQFLCWVFRCHKIARTLVILIIQKLT